MERRKRRSKILTYDDVLLRLRDTLLDDVRGRSRAPAARALRRRPGRRVPGHRPGAVGHHAPRLRRRAARRWCSSAIPSRPSTPSAAPTSTPTSRRTRWCESEWTLDVNWRSDQGLLEAYDALVRRRAARLRGHHLPHDPGGRRPPEPRLDRCARAGALARPDRARRGRARPAHPDEGQPRRGDARSADRPGPRRRRRRAARRPARRSSHAGVTGPSSTRQPLAPRPHRRAGADQPRRRTTGARCAARRSACRRSSAARASVFATEPAREWLRLLEALERPTARDRASLGGLDLLRRLDGGAGGRRPTRSEWEDLHWSLHRWAAPAARPGRRRAARDGQQRPRRARRACSPRPRASAS